MSEDNLDVASEFAELTGTEIEILPESKPSENSSDMTLDNNIVDLTTSDEGEQQEEKPVDIPKDEESPQEIIESSLKSDSRKEDGEQQGEDQESTDDSYNKTLSMLNETYST